MQDSILLVEASLRRNYQDLRFCPQDDAQDLQLSLSRSFDSLQSALPDGRVHDARNLKERGLPYLQSLLLPPNFRSLKWAGLVVEDKLSASLNMDEHLVFRATGQPGQEQNLISAVRQMERQTASDQHPYAQDRQFGFLSFRPMLAGSGLHLGLVLHLPLLFFLKQIRPQTQQLAEQGCLLSPLSLSEARNPAKLYLLSNAGSRGLADSQVLETVLGCAQSLVHKEGLLRQKAMKANGHSSLADQVWRSYGLLRYARRLSETDFLSHWSNLRLGAASGILPLSLQAADQLLTLANEYPFLDAVQDHKTVMFQRADQVRQALNGG